MKLAAASCGVSEEGEIFLLKLLVLSLFPLILDVLFNHIFVPVLAHRADEVPVRPKLPAPQLLLDLRARREDLPRRDALYQLHYLLRAVHRYRLHQKMHVVFVRPDLQKRNLIPLADFQTNFFQLLINRRRKNGSAVLRRTHDVIHQDRDVMTFVDEPAHSHILAQQAAGNYTRSDEKRIARLWIFITNLIN